REPYKGAARPRDRPHQLHQLLGQPVSRPTHRRGVRPDAGVALARCRYCLCPCSSWHVARTTAKARRSGLGLGTTNRRPSAGFLPVSTSLPSSQSGSRSCNRITPPQPPRTLAKYLPSLAVVEPCFFLVFHLAIELREPRTLLHPRPPKPNSGLQSAFRPNAWTA